MSRNENERLSPTGPVAFHVCKDPQTLGPELAFLAQNGAA